MFKRFLMLVCLAGLGATSASLHAQAAPTAIGNSGRLQAGAGGMLLNTDYIGKTTNIGITAYVDYDFFKFVGVEATGHFKEFYNPSDVTEDSALVGPRLSYHRRRLTGYVKALFGEAKIVNQDTPRGQSYFTALNPAHNYFIYAIGGGLEYQATRHINVRVLDFETQSWGNFEPNSLTPYTITVGAAYVIR